MSGEDAVRVIGDYSHFLNYAERRAPHEDAEDAVQEAFLELVKRPALNYNNPRAAMMRIVRNEIIDLRKKKRSAHHEEIYLEHIAEPEADDELQGMVFALHRAIDELPNIYRVIVKDKLDGLGYEDICAKYQISSEAARSRFFRACLFLKEKLIAYDLKSLEEKSSKVFLRESSVA